MEKLKKNKWFIFGVVLLVLQVATSILAIVQLYLLNMLPNTIFAALVAVLVFLLLLDGAMLLLKGKKGKLLYTRRGVGAFICICMVAAGSMITFYVGNLNHTVSAISTDSKVSNVIAVYVQADDEAQQIGDTKNYTYGITEEYDYSNTEKTLEALGALNGSEITTSSYQRYN